MPLQVPSDEDRFADFPQLVGKEIEVEGCGFDQSAVDVVLSNAGWISVAADVGAQVVLRAYTPGGVGISTRLPLLPEDVKLHGGYHPVNPTVCLGTSNMTRPYKGCNYIHHLHKGKNKRTPRRPKR